MKKLSFALLLFFLSTIAARAQGGGYTQTTGTKACYANGSVQAAYINQSSQPGLPLLNGSVFPQANLTNMDSSGVFSFYLADNFQIVPSPSQWKFTVCAKSGGQPLCGTTQMTVTGPTQDISAAINAFPCPSTGGGSPAPPNFTTQLNNGLGQFGSDRIVHHFPGTSQTLQNCIDGAGSNGTCQISPYDAIAVTAPTTIPYSNFNLTCAPGAMFTKQFDGNAFSVTGSNVQISNCPMDGGQIGKGDVTQVTGNGTTATYTYTLASGAAPTTGNVAIVSKCSTSPSGGFNGVFTLTSGGPTSFTVASTQTGTESEGTCTVTFVHGGNVIDAESVTNLNLDGVTIQNAGNFGVLLNNATNSSVRNSSIVQNALAGVGVAGTGVEGISITGNSFNCSNATAQNNDCLSFKATPPANQKAGNLIQGNHFTSGAGFAVEMQYIGNSVKIVDNDCNIQPTPIVSSAFPGFAIFSCYSIQDMHSVLSHNTAVNLTGQPADFPLIESFGYKNTLEGNSVVGGDVFFYNVESVFSGNNILLGQLLLPNGNESGNPVANGNTIIGNQINTSCAKPGQSWTPNTKLQLGYCIVDSFNSLWIVVSDHATNNQTGSTTPFTSQHPIGTQLTEGNSITWQNYGQQLYGDAGSTGTVSSVVAASGTATYTYSIIQGGPPSIGNSAVMAGCQTPALNGIQTVTATGSGTFSTASSATVTESESSCKATFTKGRTAISINCNSTGLSCANNTIALNTLIDNNSTNGQGFVISAATGAAATNTRFESNTFIGFNTCYSLSAVSAATAKLSLNDEAGCTNLGTINKAQHYSLQQFLLTTQKNFVPNSDFLFNAVGWTLDPAYSIYSGNANEGSGKGITYTSTGVAPNAVFAISQPIAVTPGQTWTLSGFIDASASTSGTPPSIAFDRCDAGAGYVNASATNGIAGNVRASGVIPAGVSTGCIIISMGSALAPAGSLFYFSSPQFEVGPQATFYKPNNWSDSAATIPSGALPGSTGTNLAYSNCSGTATSSGTSLSFFGLGTTTTTCTGTTGGSNGLLMAGSGVMSRLTVRCGTSGVNTSSGVFTIFDSPSGSGGAATPITLTYGAATAGTFVQDNLHTANYAAGDLITVRYTTQASETLANCTVSFRY